MVNGRRWAGVQFRPSAPAQGMLAAGLFEFAGFCVDANGVCQDAATTGYCTFNSLVSIL